MMPETQADEHILAVWQVADYFHAGVDATWPKAETTRQESNTQFYEWLRHHENQIRLETLKVIQGEDYGYENWQVAKVCRDYREKLGLGRFEGEN